VNNINDQLDATIYSWKPIFTPGNPYQEGQQEDQRHSGGMMLEKI